MGKEYIRSIEISESVAAGIRPILFDDLEGSFRWHKMGTGTVEKTSKYSKSGANSLHLKTKEVGPAIGDEIFGTITTFPRDKRFLKAVIHILTPYDLYNCLIKLALEPQVESKDDLGEIAYDPRNDRIGYRGSDGDFHYFEDQIIKIPTEGWAELELTIDTQLREYYSMRANQRLISLRGLKLRRAMAVGPNSWIECRIGIRTLAANTEEMYFDDILIDYIDKT